jgi:hypothetical protein
MDLDRWKDRLHEMGETGGPAPAWAGGELATILRDGVRKSRRAAIRAFFWELAAIALIYLLAAGVLLIVGRPPRSFQLKIIVLSSAAVVPVVFVFLRYLASARPDLGRPVLDVLDESIRRLRSFIRAYRWAGLTLAAAIAAALWTDAGFRALPAGWIWGITGFILATAVLSFPYLRAVYGRRLRELEDLARDARGAGSSGPGVSSP